MNRRQRLILLRLIKDNRDILLGKSVQNRDEKCRKWAEVFEISRQLGVPWGDRNWRYFRDVVWPNLRKVTLAKLENRRNQGNSALTEVDIGVLDILGVNKFQQCSYDEHVHTGLDEVLADPDEMLLTPEFYGSIKNNDQRGSTLYAPTKADMPCSVDDEHSPSSVSVVTPPLLSGAVCTVEAPEPIFVGSPEDKKPIIGTMGNLHHHHPHHEPSRTQSLATIKRMKLELECENLRLKNRLMRLEILAKERSLGLQSAIQLGGADF